MKDYITVGSVGSSGGGASEDLVSDEVPLTPVTSSETISTHYGSTPITNVSSTVGSAIGAGRDRVGVVGSPLEFRAEMNQPYSRQNIFSWNFGDGMQGGGAVLNHVYEYPGEYVVVLKVSLSDDEAVSRVNVKIMNPQLAITDVSSDRIEITNNSSYEINLFGRALLSGGEAFVFLQDTIIKSGKSISFSQKATGLNPVGMHDANLIVVGDSIGGVALRNKIEEEKLTKIDEIREQITVLEQRKLALIRAQAQPVGANVIEIGVSQNQNSDDAEVAIQSQTAYVAQSIESDSWFETLKKFFLRTR
ncbi:MAG: PKD domain-containing protein [bacterium]|nr:PKD domain-containing protein [bacterium]